MRYILTAESTIDFVSDIIPFLELLLTMGTIIIPIFLIIRVIVRSGSGTAKAKALILDDGEEEAVSNTEGGLTVRWVYRVQYIVDGYRVTSQLVAKRRKYKRGSFVTVKYLKEYPGKIVYTPYLAIVIVIITIIVILCIILMCFGVFDFLFEMMR